MDFVVLRNKKPEFAVECKIGEKDIGRNIAYYAERTNIPIFYQVHMGRKDYEAAKLRARSLPITNFSKILKI